MKIRKITTILIAALMVVMAGVSVFAVGVVETDRDCSLVINYKDGETPLTGAEFKIYKVAEVTPYMDLTVSRQMQAYADSINMDDLDKAGWDALAVTLSAYIAKDNVEALAGGKTNENGQIAFPEENMEMKPGMYLVIGSSHTQGGYTYTPAPTMVFLPHDDTEANAWVYEESISPKASKVVIDTPAPRTISLKALKSWKGDDKEDRPESITVTLLKNGKVYDTKTLTEDGNWRCEWSGLDSGADWQLTEDVPSGYTVQVEREGITFVVANTKKEVEPPLEEPPVDIDEPDVPLDEPDVEELPEEDVPLADLPQTGLLWWPVAVMAMAGLTFLTLGIAKRRTC